MLSICIPVYNYPIGDLLSELSRQAQHANVPVEVVVLDDGSSEQWQAINQREASTYSCVSYHYQKNAGRSKTRNSLASLAKYDFLAFLDCDCSVGPDYIANILGHLMPTSIIVGGLVYPPKPSDKHLLLRWTVGTVREVRRRHERQQKPFASFLSSNFVIPRRLMEATGFNSQLNGYGHEDTVLGIELQRQNIPILHIDNPVCHLGIDNAADFILKIEQSLVSLKRIEELNLAAGQIKLLQTYDKLKKMGVAGFFSMVFVVFKPMLRRFFINGGANLFLFDVYKLGFYCLLNRK
jgi:glycosyltransferase involved in cell wall biosynthesis